MFKGSINFFLLIPTLSYYITSFENSNSWQLIFQNWFNIHSDVGKGFQLYQFKWPDFP
jgi:hypothetical protein